MVGLSPFATPVGTIAPYVFQLPRLDCTHAYKFCDPVFNCLDTPLFYSGDEVALLYFNGRYFLHLMARELGEEWVSCRCR